MLSNHFPIGAVVIPLVLKSNQHAIMTSKHKQPSGAKGKPASGLKLTPEQQAALALSETIKVREKPKKLAKAKAKKPDSSPQASKPQVEPRKRGRVTTYDQTTVDHICERIAEGEPLRQICREDGMPAWRTVYSWMSVNDEFAARFARARDIGEEAIGQECLDIADNAANDWMEKFDQHGECIGWQLNGDHVQRSKLRIETRLKLLAKWNPKKWGDKVDMNHGGQKDNPIQALFQQVQGTPIRPAGVEGDEQ